MGTFIVVVLILIAIAACILLGMALWGQSLNRAQEEKEALKLAEPQAAEPEAVPAPIAERTSHIEAESAKLMPIELTPEVKSSQPKRKSANRNQVEVDYDQIVSFPGIDTRQARCVGMMHYLSDNQRRRLNTHIVLAIPEPSNRHDENAVTITSVEGRRYGYLSAGQAKMYSSLIQQVGILQLNCRVDGIKLWLDMPTVPALRKAINEYLNA